MDAVTTSRNMNTLDFLMAIYKQGKITNMREKTKGYGLNNITASLMMQCGLLQKFQNGKPVGYKTRGIGLHYEWKNKDVVPNINTAERLNKLIADYTKQVSRDFKERSKAIDVKSDAIYSKSSLMFELNAIKEKYEGKMDAVITMRVEIKSVSTIEL